MDGDNNFLVPLEACTRPEASTQCFALAVHESKLMHFSQHQTAFSLVIEDAFTKGGADLWILETRVLDADVLHSILQSTI